MIKTAFQLRTIGNLLRERRNERNLSLRQVSEIIKIRSEYLEALEEGNYKVFPSEVYIKGFLKNYAKFLEISQDRALAMYRRESEIKQGESSISMIAKIKEKGLSFTVTPNRIIAIAVAVGILGIIIYLGTYLGKVLKKPDLALTMPVAIAADSEGSIQTSSNIVDIQGTVEIGSTLKINGQELKLNNFEKFGKEFKLDPGLNKFTLKAESQFGRETQVVLNVVREESLVPDTTVMPTLSPTPAVNPTIEVQLEIVTKDAYLEISVDGSQKAGRVFTVGSKLNYSAQAKFEIYSPRPDAISLIINGQAEQLGSQKLTWTVVSGQIVKQ